MKACKGLLQATVAWSVNGINPHNAVSIEVQVYENLSHHPQTLWGSCIVPFLLPSFLFSPMYQYDKPNFIIWLKKSDSSVFQEGTAAFLLGDQTGQQ